MPTVIILPKEAAVSETGDYITKKNPSVADWLEFNRNYFATLKGESPDAPPCYAPLTDVDMHAEAAGIELGKYFDKLRQQVGNLGRAALELVHSEMDDAWHVVVVPQETDDEPKEVGEDTL